MNALKELVISDFTDAAAIENFRVGADGTLTKRGGYITLFEDFSKVRGCFCDGSGILYFVSGNDFYSYDGVSFNAIDTLVMCEFESEDEKCIIYSYADIVYIIGGGCIYRYYPGIGSLLHDTYYVPIFRSDSESYAAESPNMITNRVREVITLANVIDTCLVRPAPVAIHSVMLDGVYLTDEQYSVTVGNGNSAYIKIKDSTLTSAQNELILDYEADASAFVPEIKGGAGCTNAYVYEGDSGVRVFLYGSDTGALYYSEPTVDILGNVIISDYFPAKNKLTVGSGNEKILAVTRQGERVIVITQRATYYLVEVTEKIGDTTALKRFRAVLISDELFIDNPLGYTVYNERIYMASSLGLFCLSFNPVDFKYTRTRIDIPDNVGVGRGEYSSLCLHFDRPNNELWCQNGATVAVYNLTDKVWYRFTGFRPSMLFSYDSKTAFAEGERLCIFGPSEAGEDCEEVEAFVETQSIDFGNIFEEKTVFGFGAAFERQTGAVLECQLTSDKDSQLSFSVSEANVSESAVTVVKRTHARLGGCYYVTCRITSPKDVPSARLLKIMLSYRTVGGTK